MQFTDTVKAGYTNLWQKAHTLPQYDNTLAQIARRIESNRPHYEAVQMKTGVPWWWIGCIHIRESNADFDTYLGNGEPLNRVTRLVPRGRGPFHDWDTGAIDALKLEGLDKVTDWSLPHALYLAEQYNGWGYINRCNSPYIWSFTNLYSSGKFTETIWGSHFDPRLKDRQPGVASMIKAMVEAKIIPDFSLNTPPDVAPSNRVI